MDFRILGPLEVRDEPGPVVLGGVKPRAVLAVLLLNANEPVSADRLANALWGEEAPAGAAKTVQVYVSRLRKALDHPDLVATTPAGYCLHVAPDELDVDRFAQPGGGRPRGAGRGPAGARRTILREALALWRGPPLADLAFEPFAQAEIARLEEQRLTRAGAPRGRRSRRGPPHRARGRAPAPRSPSTRTRAARRAAACSRSTAASASPRRSRPTARPGTHSSTSGHRAGAGAARLHEAILRQDAVPRPAGAGGRAAGRARPRRRHAVRGPRRRARLARGRCGTRLGPAAARPSRSRGARGIGKSRSAAELAHGIHAHGGLVLYAAGDGSRRARCARCCATRARRRRPTLLVVDDADRAGAECAGRARGARARRRPASRSCCSSAPRSPHRSAAAPTLTAGAARRLRRRGDRAGYASGRPGMRPAGRRAARGQPRRPEERPRGGERSGRAARRRTAWTVAGRGRRRPHTRCARWSPSWPTAWSSCRGRASAPRCRRPRASPWCARSRGSPRSSSRTREYFFGRERLVAELVARLVGAPLLAIVGASGSGKSSVLRAGLLPALEGGILPGSKAWERVLIRPGSIRSASWIARSRRSAATAAWWSPSTSSRRPSPPAATSASAPRSSDARAYRPRRARPVRRRARDPRGPLRALRGVSRAVRACSPPIRCW